MRTTVCERATESASERKPLLGTAGKVKRRDTRVDCHSGDCRVTPTARQVPSAQVPTSTTVRAVPEDRGVRRGGRWPGGLLWCADT